MAEPGTEIAAALASARERAGFSQEEVADLLGQKRPVVSYWESGARRPNGHQLDQLATLYRVSLDQLLQLESASVPLPLARLFFRAAENRLAAGGKLEVQRFLAFLDDYGDLLDLLDEPPGMESSPLQVGEGFTSKDDARRKAQQARAWLGLGDGPVGDLDGLADLHGISVYYAALGPDLKRTVSGAFLPHHRVGFAVLVNLETTPGHRRFTLAHELAHALVHGDTVYVDYYGRREAAERFANAFAAEFLVPTASLRSAVETLRVRDVRDAETVVHLQRLFGVSYSMMLVRLSGAGLLTEPSLERLRQARPVRLAERLGYATDEEEWRQDPDEWGMGRFPGRFLHLLRRALTEKRISIGGAARMTGLSQRDIEELVADEPLPERSDEEFDVLSTST